MEEEEEWNANGAAGVDDGDRRRIHFSWCLEFKSNNNMKIKRQDYIDNVKAIMDTQSNYNYKSVKDQQEGQQQGDQEPG